MKSIKVLLFAVLFSFAACSDDEQVVPNPQPDNLAQEIENLIQPMVDDQTTVGAAVGIIQPGGEKSMFFFGEKVKGNGNLPDENTIFEIGSITKTMTAAVLADMALKGEINLDDPVENYVPGISNFPNYNGEKILLKHLANHTSSLPPLPGNFLHPNFDESQPYLNYTKELMYDFLNSYELPYAIGTIDQYSNFAMGLLGHALGEVRGTTFESQLQEVVLNRIGMENSYTVLPGNKNNVAQPYNEDLNAVPMWDMSDVTFGAGGVKSSLKDMMAYLETNLGYGTSDLKEALALTHVNTQTINDPFNKGLAWTNIYKEADGTTLTWHDGGTAGTVTFLGFVKELDMGVILMFNTEIVDRSGDETKAIQTGVDIIEAMKKY